MKSWAGEGMAALVAAVPPSPLTLLERALRRHAHQLDCYAGRVTDGTVHDLMAADRAHVLARLDRLERTP